METAVTQLQMIPLIYYVIFCSALFTIGVVGVLVKRNALAIFMSVELMLNSANLLIAAFAAYRNDPSGQVFVFFIMVVAAAEIAIGLALLVVVYRSSHTIDINILNRLKW
ncbi:NADH-quinone oxidoreductase subunit NuoK [Microbacter margulisiae]|uniref:NADH-quinone oxidoreductase subunit K n=1 Tax=Microbacter margulisiae TaxID=1350067 RepID=A0A7W5DNR8_9PORP|nr:NADH-quinone oxidoreductase subunit NuoK [Microbacter margulisiae]MBB3186299.1 NADH-quinone oxidoreductase subunit K [Microbacter margulisiae]